jgi:ATP-dependent DNA helicase RecQ
LMEELKRVRKDLADSLNTAAYMIFSDKTLQEMCDEKPITFQEMSHVSGVGQFKLDTYGHDFINAIRDYTSKSDLKNVKGKTYVETLELWNQGKNTSEIAKTRGISETTVYSHLAHLIEKGEDIDTAKLIKKKN